MEGRADKIPQRCAASGPSSGPINRCGRLLGICVAPSSGATVPTMGEDETAPASQLAAMYPRFLQPESLEQHVQGWPR